MGQRRAVGHWGSVILGRFHGIAEMFWALVVRDKTEQPSAFGASPVLAGQARVRDFQKLSTTHHRVYPSY